MTGDISARRGALPIKSTPPDHSEMVNGFELFKGVAGDTLKKKPRRWGQSTGANRGDQERPPAPFRASFMTLAAASRPRCDKSHIAKGRQPKPGAPARLHRLYRGRPSEPSVHRSRLPVGWYGGLSTWRVAIRAFTASIPEILKFFGEPTAGAGGRGLPAVLR